MQEDKRPFLFSSSQCMQIVHSDSFFPFSFSESLSDVIGREEHFGLGFGLSEWNCGYCIIYISRGKISVAPVSIRRPIGIGFRENCFGGRNQKKR